MQSILTIKDTALEFISFSTPRAIVVNLSAVLGLLWTLPTSTVSGFPVKCLFKTYIMPLIFAGHCPSVGLFTGCNCPACGITRGVSRLLHGDVQGAIAFNPFAIPVTVVMIALIAINVYRILRRGEPVHGDVKKIRRKVLTPTLKGRA